MRTAHVTIIKSGNRIVVEPTTPEIRELLEPQLCFKAVRFLYGDELRIRKQRVISELLNVFVNDHRDRIGTTLGLYSRIRQTLLDAGYTVSLRDLTPHKDPTVFEPQWDRILDPKWAINLRYGQDKFLVKCITNLQAGLPGRIDCPTGYGKSYLIMLLAKVLPRAKIHVASKRVPVLKERILPDLQRMLPDVGMVGGGLKKMGHRVQLFTFDSLHHSDGDADILAVDECHEAAADDAAEQLARYSRSVNFGFSASHDMRLDKKDLRVEAMFGPVIYEVSYQEAVDHGLIVPIEIHWTTTIMDEDPCEGITDSVERQRRGVWRNATRNKLIAADARRYDADTQVLIACSTVEHALVLKQFLPEFALVYNENSITPDEYRYYKQHGLMLPDEPFMTVERRGMLARQFETGAVKKAICTTVWNVGVSFNQLQVLIRADAGGSPTMDTQIPGRTSRLSDGKDRGIIHDYYDRFNKGFAQRSAGRKKSYEGHNWTQLWPGEKSGRKKKDPRYTLVDDIT